MRLLSRFKTRTQKPTYAWNRSLPEYVAMPGHPDSIVNHYKSKNLLLTEDNRVPLTWFTHKTNFGDLVSPWLMEKMTGREPVQADTASPHYVMIGSIINKGTPTSILWGTGTYGTEGKSEVCADSTYTAVRGPLTRSKLGAAMAFGIKVPEVYGDPALLAPLYYFPNVKVTHEYGVIVRWRERKWAAAHYGPQVKLIDFARDDVEGVIRDMLSCKKILSSSLHGLIMADAYGIPNAWLASRSPRGGEYKFHDYFASVRKLRRAQHFDPSAEDVTVERLKRELEFDDTIIRFDCRTLMDSCPFLVRR